jgi:hypothetical protein
MLVDPEFALRVTDAYALCQATSTALTLGEGSADRVRDATGKLVEACGYNLGMLMPSIYPRFVLDPNSGETLPLDYVNRPYMFAFGSLLDDCTLTMITGRQVGKCVTGDTVIQTSIGEMSVKALFEMGVPI